MKSGTRFLTNLQVCSVAVFKRRSCGVVDMSEVARVGINSQQQLLQHSQRRFGGQSCNTARGGLVDRATTQPEAVWSTELQHNQRRFGGQSYNTARGGLVDRAATQPEAVWWTELQHNQRRFGGQSCNTARGCLVDRAATQPEAVWWTELQHNQM